MTYQHGVELDSICASREQLDRACGVCMCAKQAREPFHRSANLKNTECVPDLFHTVVMGQFQVKPGGGGSYAWSP